MSGIGQVFTPGPIARLMSGWLLEDLASKVVHILDAGAGSGHLTEAVMERLPSDVIAHHTLIEIDPLLAEDARLMLGQANHYVLKADFIQLATGLSQLGDFSHAILNPPYARLSAASASGRALQKEGMFVPNLYAAFLWLTANRILPKGRIVAIVPRSFFNGKLFRKMRVSIFSEFSIRRIHTFPDRISAFARDNVLQETVIVVLDRVLPKTDSCITITTGHVVDGCHEIMASRKVSYSDVISPLDAEFHIRVPATDQNRRPLSDELIISAPFSVSTGKVVAYRSKEHLFDTPVEDAVPLIDSRTSFNHLGRIEPSAYYKVTQSNRRNVLKPGIYVLINRFSPTERRPRLNVTIADCTSEQFSLGVAFENHLNVICKQGEGMSAEEAKLMADRLMNPASDAQFIELSGSTQVNVSDLKTLRITSTNNNQGEK